MIRVDQNKCTSCELCITTCPFGALASRDGQIEVLDSCRLCKICVDCCPEGALSFDDVDERDADSPKPSAENVMVVAEFSGGKLHPVTYELIGKGRELADHGGHQLFCVVVGTDTAQACSEILEYGVDRCLVYDNPELRYMRIEPYTNAIADAIERTRPAIVLFAATPAGRSLAPRLAARLRTGLTADCTRLEVRGNLELVQVRPAFGGSIMAQIVTPRHRPQMATMRYKVMEPAKPRRMPGAKIEACRLAPELLASKIRILKSEQKPPESSISDAEVVVAAGRGFRERADLCLASRLADLLGGKLGVTRPLVENGWADHDQQIGLSGRAIRPKLLITVGVLGAVQFTASIAGAELIVSINRDANAPIFEVAHYGLVGDLYEVVPCLIAELRGA